MIGNEMFQIPIYSKLASFSRRSGVKAFRKKNSYRHHFHSALKVHYLCTPVNHF